MIVESNLFGILVHLELPNSYHVIRIIEIIDEQEVTPGGVGTGLAEHSLVGPLPHQPRTQMPQDARAGPCNEHHCRHQPAQK